MSENSTSTHKQDHQVKRKNARGTFGKRQVDGWERGGGDDGGTGERREMTPKRGGSPATRSIMNEYPRIDSSIGKGAPLQPATFSQLETSLDVGTLAKM